MSRNRRIDVPAYMRQKAALREVGRRLEAKGKKDSVPAPQAVPEPILTPDTTGVDKDTFFAAHSKKRDEMIRKLGWPARMVPTAEAAWEAREVARKAEPFLVQSRAEPKSAGQP